ncbi:DHH family phosphoesterase [Sedimentibacter sp. MB31-C6]|uniref:DHH family phosphoesterase n=1 Tax=Sedimentibacter sp. MB31-C6 TaxID=3109366 RepID=UPI002DDCE906|nr:DHH family phosphoesterase [Sedimentibacter sp. MB36-C1]WSI02951.1 DHH family phosphoesterase [Sedimentibacter sp. MB36-C1]
MDDNKKTPKFLEENSFIYFILTIVIIAIFIIERMYYYAGIFGLILIIITAITLKRQITNEKDFKKYIINYTKNIENLSVNSFYNFPTPICVIGNQGKLFWINSKFNELVGENIENLENITGFFSDFPIDYLEGKQDGIINNIELPEVGRNFNIMFYELEEGKFGEGNSYVLYWIENTAYTILKNKYNDERPIAMLIQIDNYDEISEKMDKGEKSAMTAEVEKILNKYASEMNGFVLKYDTYRFFMMIENKYLDALESKKFSMLEDVKGLKNDADYYFTLSIGVGAYSKTLAQLVEYAKGALDVSLGRGGDQAVVKRINSVKFYGGKSKAVEKRTKVKARIISYALRQIIDQSSNVIIMGHRVGDMDSLGASIGLYSIARSRGKKSYIVLNNVNYALKNMYERIKVEDSHYLESIIDTETALSLVEQNTLCVVLDTHRGSYTEAPELLTNVEKIVLIDHHRRSEEYIENTLLDYIEPYASSTCELVSEIIQYMDDHIKLTKFEADALMAGIVVDTNSFTFKTGVRTFEAASFLRRNGADTVDVKQLFNDSLDAMKKKTEIIDKSEIKYGDIAISYIDEIADDSNVIAAQSADELLTIKDVVASFVLVRNEDYINISGRSIGNVNVQVIMEYLGGGGHLNMAGAQIQTTDMEEAKAKLYEAISYYKEESVNK